MFPPGGVRGGGGGGPCLLVLSELRSTIARTDTLGGSSPSSTRIRSSPVGNLLGFARVARLGVCGSAYHRHQKEEKGGARPVIVLCIWYFYRSRLSLSPPLAHLAKQKKKRKARVRASYLPVRSVSLIAAAPSSLV